MIWMKQSRNGKEHVRDRMSNLHPLSIDYQFSMGKYYETWFLHKKWQFYQLSVRNSREINALDTNIVDIFCNNNVAVMLILSNHKVLLQTTNISHSKTAVFLDLSSTNFTRMWCFQIGQFRSRRRTQPARVLKRSILDRFDWNLAFRCVVQLQVPYQKISAIRLLTTENYRPIL